LLGEIVKSFDWKCVSEPVGTDGRESYSTKLSGFLLENSESCNCREKKPHSLGTAIKQRSSVANRQILEVKAAIEKAGWVE
jgi:hypothetical protein